MKRTFLPGLALALVLFLCLSVLISCNNNKNAPGEEIVIPKPVLTEQTIFDFRTIQRVRRAGNSIDAENSKALLESGIQSFKANKSAEAVEFLKASILSYPTAKAYFEFGNIMLSSKNYMEAEKAFSISELMNYPKLSRLYIKLSKLHAAQKNIEKGNHYLKLALEKGFNDYNKLMNDSDFKSLRNSDEYRTLIADLKPNQMGRKEALFDVFTSFFPRLKLPYNISRSDIDDFNYENYIPYDFEELLAEDIRKKENKEYSYIGIVDSTSKHLVVLYSSIDAVEENYPPSTETFLVVYDKKGNIIDDLLFACSCSPTLSYTGFIDKKKEIRITEFETIWKEDPSTTDFLDNEIHNIVNKYVYYYKITKEGKIRLEKKIESGIIARI